MTVQAFTEFCQATDLTQIQLAELLQCTQSAISEWQAGKRAVPRKTVAIIRLWEENQTLKSLQLIGKTVVHLRKEERSGMVIAYCGWHDWICDVQKHQSQLNKPICQRCQKLQKWNHHRQC